MVIEQQWSLLPQRNTFYQTVETNNTCKWIKSLFVWAFSDLFDKPPSKYFILSQLLVIKLLSGQTDKECLIKPKSKALHIWNSLKNEWDFVFGTGFILAGLIFSNSWYYPQEREIHMWLIRVSEFPLNLKRTDENESGWSTSGMNLITFTYWRLHCDHISVVHIHILWTPASRGCWKQHGEALTGPADYRKAAEHQTNGWSLCWASLPEVLLGCFTISVVCRTCLCISADAEWPRAAAAGAAPWLCKSNIFPPHSWTHSDRPLPQRCQLWGKVVVKAALVADRKMTSWDVVREIWVRRIYCGSVCVERRWSHCCWSCSSAAGGLWGGRYSTYRCVG